MVKNFEISYDFYFYGKISRFCDMVKHELRVTSYELKA